MIFKAVLFDMDGVIVDTEPLHRSAYFKMFEAVSIDVTKDMFESFTGQSTIEICKFLCQHFNLTQEPEDLAKVKRAYFKDLFDTDDTLCLIPGVLNLIKNYHNNGLKLILASSASMANINRIFKRFDLDSYFSGKFSGADLEKSKPHPEIFLKAAASTGFDNKSCFVIEDSTNGIKAAYNAGIYCVAYKSFHSKNQDYTLANKVIAHFSEIYFSNLKML